MPSKVEDAKKDDFSKVTLSYMPRWAWAVCAIIIAVSLSIRQVGLDVTTPLNRIMSAHAIRIEKGQDVVSNEKYQELLNRIAKLEQNSHPPAHSK